jgi:hypothetical protein
MAYFNGSGGYYWLGQYVPRVKTTRIYCDACAETEIPLPSPEDFARDFPNRSPGARHHDTEFRWAPHYGAPCVKCGTPA